MRIVLLFALLTPFVTGLVAVFASLPAQAAGNTLTLATVTAAAGSSGSFAIALDNSDAVASGQARFTYAASLGLTITGVQVTSRTTGFASTGSTYNTGNTSLTGYQVLFYNLSNLTIAPGTGAILTFSYTLAANASGSSTLAFTRAILSDPAAQELPLTPVDGVFTVTQATVTATPTATPSATATNTTPPTATRTATSTPTATATATGTTTSTPTATATNTATSTATNAPPTATSTLAPTNTATATSTATRTATATSTSTHTPTATSVPTATATPTLASTNTATATSTATNTATATATSTATNTATSTTQPTATSTPSATSTATHTPTATSTMTSAPPTATASSTATSAPTMTATSSSTPTATPTDAPTTTSTSVATVTNTPTSTPISTATDTPTSTTTATPTSVATSTETETATATATAVNTLPPTVTSTPLATATATSVATATATDTPLSTATATLPSPTQTATATATLSAPPTDTSTPTTTPTASATSTATSEPTATPVNTPTPTVVATPFSGLLYVSSSRNGRVDGLSYRDEDILLYDSSTNRWQLYFDGSDVGVANADLDAFAFLPDGSILMSFDRPIQFPTLGLVDDSDLVKFIPTQLGSTTSGTFEFFFDGSDVDLNSSSEDIDAVIPLPDGSLLISVYGSARLGDLRGRDEDLLHFTPTALGQETAGSWSIYFDGSAVGLTEGSEDVTAATLGADGTLYLATKGDFAVAGLAGDRDDLFGCILGATGENSTACTFFAFFNGDTVRFDRPIDGATLGASALNRVFSAAVETPDQINDDQFEVLPDEPVTDDEEFDSVDDLQTDETPLVDIQIYLPVISQ